MDPYQPASKRTGRLASGSGDRIRLAVGASPKVTTAKYATRKTAGRVATNARSAAATSGRRSRRSRQTATVSHTVVPRKTRCRTKTTRASSPSRKGIAGSGMVSFHSGSAGPATASKAIRPASTTAAASRRVAIGGGVRVSRGGSDEEMSESSSAFTECSRVRGSRVRVHILRARSSTRMRASIIPPNATKAITPVTGLPAISAAPISSPATPT